MLTLHCGRQDNVPATADIATGGAQVTELVHVRRLGFGVGGAFSLSLNRRPRATARGCNHRSTLYIVHSVLFLCNLDRMITAVLCDLMLNFKQSIVCCSVAVPQRCTGLILV